MVSPIMAFNGRNENGFRSGVEYGKGRLNICLVGLAAGLIPAFAAHGNMLARFSFFVRADYVLPAIHLIKL
jgi:hypothetical protein